MYLLGIDVGTSGCKASVITADGRVVGKAYREYFLEKPRPGWEELDPHEIWDAVQEVIAKSVASVEKKEPIGAISISSFGETVIPVDENGTPVYRGILYIDPRGQEEAQKIKELMGEDRVNAITGASVHSMYSLPKIMWFRDHEPELYAKTWKFFLIADYVLFRLGAEPHTDYTLATRTMAFDIVKKEWSKEILDAAGVPVEKFGKPVQSGTAVGKLREDLKAAFGIEGDALLVAGGHDQPCAALGAGAIQPGLAIDGLGTTECVCPAFSQPAFGPNMIRNGFACVPHTVAGLYVTYAFTFSSGSVLKWYRDVVRPEYKQEAAKQGVNVYDLIIDCATEGPSGLLLLPHFAGAATPYMDNDSKGMMVGLSINTKTEDISKAILEGITFEMMLNLDRLTEVGVEVNELRAVGGLAKSDRFLQLKSDMMGRVISTLEVAEAGTVGVAILAGTACGMYKSVEEAVASLVKKKRVFQPNMEIHAQYQELYQKYQKLYPAMKEILR